MRSSAPPPLPASSSSSPSSSPFSSRASPQPPSAAFVFQPPAAQQSATSEATPFRFAERQRQNYSQVSIHADANPFSDLSDDDDDDEDLIARFAQYNSRAEPPRTAPRMHNPADMGFLPTFLRENKFATGGTSVKAAYDLGLQAQKSSRHERAFEHFKTASDLGHSNATRQLGVAYYYGRGVRTDQAKALTLFVAAARKCDPRACLNVINIANETFAFPPEAISEYRQCIPSSRLSADLPLPMASDIAIDECLRCHNGPLKFTTRPHWRCNICSDTYQHIRMDAQNCCHCDFDVCYPCSLTLVRSGRATVNQ